MGVFDTLLNLFESNALKDRVTPIYHTYITANIEVRISPDGVFVEATNQNKKILCPVTAASAGRSSGIAPHPLYDNLSYAGNMDGYKNRFDTYMEQLDLWTSDVNCPADVKVICKYLSQGNLYTDIVNSDILDKRKNKANPVDKLAICFAVDGILPYCDNHVSISAWIDYYKQQLKPNGFCFITGKEDYIPTSYQSKIRFDTDKAKLFLANKRDELDDIPMLTIGLDASQKVCNTLSYLCRNYGYHINNSCFVFFSDSDGFKNPIELKKCIYTDNIVYFIIISSAVTGRLSISHYQEIDHNFYNKCMDLMADIYKSHNSIEQLALKASRNTPGAKEEMLKKLLISFFTKQRIQKDFCMRLSNAKKQSD